MSLWPIGQSRKTVYDSEDFGIVLLGHLHGVILVGGIVESIVLLGQVSRCTTDIHAGVSWPTRVWSVFVNRDMFTPNAYYIALMNVTLKCSTFHL